MMSLGLYDKVPSAGAVLLLDATSFVTGCTISTNEQGFERLSAPTTLTIWEAFRLYDKLAPAYIGLFWEGAIVWEGRLEDPALWAGSNGSGFTIEALGYVRALTDIPYTALWSKTTVNDFRPVTADDLANVFPDRFAFDTQNRLYIAPQKNATLGTT